MRNLTFCDIRLHPSTVDSAFQEAMTGDVMPGAGDLPHPPGTLFVRSLYREAGYGFPPAYRCIVNSVLVSDTGFFGMRHRIARLGADTKEPRFRLVAGAVPDDEAALDVLRMRDGHSLVMAAVHLPLRMIQETFEKELVAALEEEVAVPSRFSALTGAIWTRDDEAVPGRVEYLVAATGDFAELRLRPRTLERIEAAGGRLVESRGFRHVGTVSGDPVPQAGG
ncbi:hypothetical protein GCM10009530_61320 [Microbispora corallina]|uniref:Uncharacterized protein n=1 Tax=Microbispora corallina TaxID=83302 RepID=A0ABQ4G8C4_9ACTN|nr:hypothetical protein [Microbispora corallina]GIH43318.1 hypothetical protein Mco01_63180 [Microbispora corallina]